MNKNIRYDEDGGFEPMGEYDQDQEDMAGFAILGDDGEEIIQPNIDELEEVPMASEIPKNEQSVIFDNASLAGIAIGSPLSLVIEDGVGTLYFKKRKVGNLKPAFVAKLLFERVGQYALITLQSNTVPHLVNIRYSSGQVEHSIQI